MTATDAAIRRPFVQSKWGYTAIAVAAAAGVCALLAGAGVPGFGLLSLSLSVLLVAGALLLAAHELDRDVVQMACIGAVAGGSTYLIGEVNIGWQVTAGGLTGALIGDWIREGRSGRLRRYWARRFVPRVRSGPAHLATWRRIAPLAIVAVSLLVAPLVIWLVARNFAPALGVDPVADLCRSLLDSAARGGALLGSPPSWHQWYIYALLILAGATLWQLHHAAVGDGGSVRHLHRLAMLHCVLLWLISLHALGGLWHAVSESATAGAADDSLYTLSIAALTEALRWSQLPALLLVLTLLLLGRNLNRYLLQHGWPLTLGLLGILGAGMAYVQVILVSRLTA